MDCMVKAPSPTVPQGACTGAEEPQPEPHGGRTVDSASLGSERSVAESVAVGPDGSTGPCPLAVVAALPLSCQRLSLGERARAIGLTCFFVSDAQN